MSQRQESSAFPYWRLSGYYFFYFSFIGIFAPYFTLYFQSLKFSATDIAVLMSLMQVMRVIAPTLWGWLADRLGARIPIIRLAGIASLLGFSTFFFTQSFAGIFVGMASMAFFWSAALPLAEALTFSHLQGTSRAYGRIRVWGSAGFVVVVLGVGYLLDFFPIIALLWMGVAVLAGIVLCAFALPEAAPPQHEHPAAPLRDVLWRKEVKALLLGSFLMAAGHGAYYVFYSILLVDLGYGKSLVGWLWTLGVLAEIGVFLWMPRLTARWSLRLIILFSMWVAVLRFLLIGWGAESPWIIVGAQLLHGITFGACHAATVAVINRWFAGALQARGQAIYGSLSFGAGGMLGGLLSGLMWEGWGAALTFSVSAGFALLGALCLKMGWVEGPGEQSGEQA